MAKHRVLIVTNRVPFPLNDGGALAMHAMVQGYYNEGWDVHLLSMNTSRHYVAPDDLPELYGKIAFDTFDINTDVNLVPTVKNFIFSRKPNHVERFYDRDFDKKLKEIINTHDPELIQIESVYLASYIPSIRQVSSARIAIRLHNVEYQIWERLSAEAPSSLKRFYLRDLAARIKRFETSAWNKADILIPISVIDATLVKEAAIGKHVFVAPFGIEMPERKDAVDEKWIGYHIGAMDWMPNAEGIRWFLEDIWPELHRQSPDFRFFFAGRNMPGSFVKYDGNGVTCSGEVANAGDFIADKKVLIVPLKSGGGIRIKILEAMAAGKLVLSTSVGMQGIEAEPGTHYLLAETEEDFQNQVQWLLANKESAEMIARDGRKMVTNQYDGRKIIATLAANLSRIL